MLTEKPRKLPKLPALFAEIVRFDADTASQRTDVVHLFGYTARLKLRRALSFAASEALKRQIGNGARG